MKIFFWNWNCGNYQFWFGTGSGTELPNWAFGTEPELWNYQAIGAELELELLIFLELWEHWYAAIEIENYGIENGIYGIEDGTVPLFLNFPCSIFCKGK